MERRETSTGPRRGKRVLTWVLGIIVGILLVAGGLLAFVWTPAGGRVVLSALASALARQDVAFSASSLRLNPLDLSLSVDSVAIGVQGRDVPPFLTAGHVEADISLLSLLRSRYVVESARLDGVRIHYAVGADGLNNLPGTSSDASPASEPLDYFVDELTGTDITVRYEDQPRSLDLTLPIQVLSVRGNTFTGRHGISLESRGGSVRLAEQLVALDSASATADLGQDDVRIDHLQISAERSSVELSGTIAQFSDPTVDLDITSRVDVARVAALAGLVEPTAGELRLDATVAGMLESPRATARVVGQDLGYRTLTDLQLEARAVYDGAAQTVDAEALTVRGPWGDISGRGLLDLGTGPSSADLRVNDLDVRRVARALDQEIPVSTRLDAQVQARWPGQDYLAASGRSELVLTAAEDGATGTLPVAGRISATAESGDVAIDIERLRVVGSQLDGRLLVDDRTTLDGILRVAIPDVRASFAAARPLTQSSTPLPLSGPVTVVAQIGGTVTSPVVGATVTAAALEIPGADAMSARAELSYADSVMVVDEFEAALGDARARADARVSFTAGQPIRGRLQVERLPIPTVLAIAGREPSEAAGVVDVTGRIDGTTEDPRAAIAVHATDLALGGEPLGTLDAAVDATRRMISLDRLTLQKAQGDRTALLAASGSYAPDSQQYDVQVGTDGWALEGVRLPDGRVLRGRLTIAAKGMGRVDAPAGQIDVSADEMRLDDRELGSLVVRASVSEAIADIEARAPRFGLDATARVGVVPPYAGRLSARIADLDFGALPVSLPAPLTGHVDAQIEAEGQALAWEDSRVEAVVDELDGAWNGQPFGIEGPARIAWDDRRLTVDGFTVAAAGSRATVEGTLPLSAGARSSAVERIAVSAHLDFPSLAAFVPSSDGWDVAGSAELSGALRGSLQALVPELSVRVADAMALDTQAGRGVTDVMLIAEARDGMLTVERFRGAWNTAFLTASGEMPLHFLPSLPLQQPAPGGTNAPATLTATLVGLNPATLPGVPELVTGNIGATLTATAAEPELSSVDATLTFTDLSTWLGAFELAQQSISTVQVSGGTVTLEDFDLSGTAGTLAADGSVGLTGARPLDLSLRGALEAVVLNAFTDGVTANGQVALDASARGTIDAPDVSGALTMSEVAVAMDDPTLAAEHVSARVDFSGNRVTLADLQAELNGGRVEGSGTLTVGAGELQDMDLRFDATDIAFDAPLDLRSLSDSHLTLTERDDQLLLQGTITLKEAGLTGNVNFDTGLLATLAAPRSLDLTEERNPLLDRMRLDVQVSTATPILVDNNLATAEVSTDLRIVGTPYDTGLSGTLTVAEGGEVTLNERRYEVERGTITFLDERRIVPSFDLRLRTEANGYDVALSVTGEPGETEMTLTSDPVLPEPDIMALLVTGRTLDEMRGEEYDVAREQVLSYLVGRVGSSFGRGIEQATGLSEVRLEPSLIANEADPGARLTIGQDLTNDLKLVYSTDLVNANDAIWVARYDLTRRFQTNVLRQSDGSYRFDFRHDVRAGGRRAPERLPRSRPTVASIVVEGDELPGERVRDRLGIQVGDAFDYFDARDGVQRIERLLQERGFLQSRVRLDQQASGEMVDLVLRITRGPHVELRYDGPTPPPSVDAAVKRQWNRGIFDVQRGQDASEVLGGWLVAERHLAGQVSWAVDETGPDARRVVFTIAPGPQYDRLDMVFEGASGVAPGTLHDIIREQELQQEIFQDPFIVTELLRRFYRESGYLVAEIAPPRPEFSGEVARIVFRVREGPRFTVGQVMFAGNQAIPREVLNRELPLRPGDPFLPATAEASLRHLRDQYWRRAFNDVRIDYSLALDRESGEVDVTFQIVEGPAAQVAEVNVEGTERVSRELVREQVEVADEQPLDLASIGRSRRNLYSTGAFSVVDITRQPIATTSANEDSTDGTPAAGPAGAGGDAGQEAPVKDVRVNVAVREVQPFQIRYGGSYNTERGAGGLADLSVRNLFGAMRLVGLSTRYDARLREARVYMQQPTLRSWPTATTASVYYREERNPETALGAPFNVDRFGLSVQQERTLRNRYLWNYGYRYERARRFIPGETAALRSVAPITSTLTRDTRDEILDATTGSFTAHALSFSPTWLGADAQYVKYYGQFFRYFPLRPPVRKRFTNELIRPRLVFASGARLGLAWGPDGMVPDTERFFAGGSTTLRGFDQNAVGSRGPGGVSNGGNALLVLNNEIRFPLISLVDGVGFLDVGGVFDRVSGFSLGGIRQAAGAGLRLRTPWFLIRGDYGLVLDPRAGEPRSRVYFSIGQAF